MTTRREKTAPKKKTLKKKMKKDGDPPFGNANGQDKEMKACENELSLTFEVTISTDSIDREALGAFILSTIGLAGAGAGVLGQASWFFDPTPFTPYGSEAVGGGDLIGWFFQFAFAATAATIVAGPSFLMNGECTACNDIFDRLTGPEFIILTMRNIIPVVMSIISEIEVTMDDDGNLTVGYGLNLCKKDGSEIEEDEVGLIVAGLNELTEGFAFTEGQCGSCWAFSEVLGFWFVKG